ncbi:Hypothetical protein NTJ_05702 [Nesidiocoris tenuis]|uniref:Uncharacterized protein n=1 Tax=Nesidiocoris tenuis TaxID=355587 RepID=A0ABN7AKZ1_9HEMI|nr:Hypothetical protein NTJ_05702 [Nesidiocoris tenuis]
MATAERKGQGRPVPVVPSSRESRRFSGPFGRKWQTGLGEVGMNLDCTQLGDKGDPGPEALTPSANGALGSCYFSTPFDDAIYCVLMKNCEIRPS